MVLLILLYLVLSFSYTIALYKEVVVYGFGHKKQHYFYYTLVIALIIFYKYLKTENFWATLKHEFAHTIFALISFKTPAALHINEDRSGSAYYYGSGNHLITLAPYFFPITAIFLMLISFIFGRPGYIFYVFMGIALAFDLITIYKDFHPYQTDLKRYNILVIIFCWRYLFLYQRKFSFGMEVYKKRIILLL